MRRGILFLSFLVAGAFLFFAQVSCALGVTSIMSDINVPSVWTKENGPYFVCGVINVNVSLTIEAGTKVIFCARYPAALVMRDSFIVNGISSEKVVFTSSYEGPPSSKPQAGDWFYLLINTPKGKEMNIQYAELRYSVLGFYVLSGAENMSIKNCDIRNNGYGIWAYNPDMIIENNVITENVSAGIRIDAGSKTTTVVNNAIFNNEIGLVGMTTGIPNPNVVKAENNWWGNASGPRSSANPEGNGDEVRGFVSFDPWLEADPNAQPPPDPGPDPAIIIPGIMGSWKKDGVWQIDPIFHTYDNLSAEFLANGYEDGEDEIAGGNFFRFPYEWRDSNVDNAKLLHTRIQDIKTQTGRPKVDIVAHSMGGLLAREYIESDYYEDDIDQLITLGTPHLGAPKDYVTWEAGEFLGLWAPVLKRIVALEALENGYLDIFSYIHKLPMKSVEELLPTYNYLYDTGDDNILRATYPVNYPRNEFLENLNNSSKVSALNNLELTKIVGKTDNEASTVSGYNVVQSSDTYGFWTDGYPKYFDIPVLNRQGIIKSSGDATVPTYSAEASEILSGVIMPIKSEHNDLPTDSQKDILEILTGQKPASEIRNGLLHNMLVIAVHSPVDVYVESPSHEKIGKNFDGGTFDQINGAYYTGYDTKSEFITIPNPENGEYKVFTQGTGEGGGFEIETTKIADNSENAEESSATVRGIAQAGEIQEAKVEIAEDNVVAINIETIRRNIEHYAKFGYIDSAEEVDYYFARLDLLEKLVGRLDDDKKDNKSIEKIQDGISSHIDHLIEHIQKNSDISIDQEAAEFLVEDFKDLKNILIPN